MLRIEFFNSDCEWQYIIEEAKKNGYENDTEFVTNRIRKIAMSFPETKGNFTCEKKIRTFRVYDEDFIRRLTTYCCTQKINPTTLMRRLVVDPVIRKHLLGEVLVTQD